MGTPLPPFIARLTRSLGYENSPSLLTTHQKGSKLKLPLLSYTDKLIDLFLEGIDITPLKTNMQFYWNIPIFNRKYHFKWWHFPASHVRYVSFREGKPTFNYKDSRHKRWDDHLQYKELIHPNCCGNLGTTSRQCCQIAGFNPK